MALKAVPAMGDERNPPGEARDDDTRTMNLIFVGQLARLDDMAAEIAARVERDAHVYWLLLTRAGGIEHGVRAMRDVADELVRGLSGDDVVPPIDLGCAVEVGEHRDGHGIDHATIRNVVTAAGSVVRHHVLVVWERLPPRSIPELEQLLERLFRREEALIERMAEELATVEGDVSGGRQMAREEFLRRLVEEQLWDEPALVLESAGTLDLQVTPPLWLVVLTEPRRVDSEAGAFEDRVAVCFREFGIPNVRPLRLHSKPGRAPADLVVVSRAAPAYQRDAPERLVRTCEDLNLLAVHVEVLALDEVHPACAQLVGVAPIAGPCSLKHGRVMALDDLAEDQSVLGLPVETQERFLVTLGKGLGDVKGAARFRALEAALETMRPNWVAAAAALSAAGEPIKADAVRARVRAFEKEIGLQIDGDLDRIHTILRLVGLRFDRLPPFDDPRWNRGDLHL